MMSSSEDLVPSRFRPKSRPSTTLMYVIQSQVLRFSQTEIVARTPRLLCTWTESAIVSSAVMRNRLTPRATRLMLSNLPIIPDFAVLGTRGEYCSKSIDHVVLSLRISLSCFHIHRSFLQITPATKKSLCYPVELKVSSYVFHRRNLGLGWLYCLYVHLACMEQISSLNQKEGTQNE